MDINLIGNSQKIYMGSLMRYAMTFAGTVEELRGLGVRPSKGKGQNFLTDRKIADWIVDSADIQPDETVLEIGPGLGILTERLAKKAKNLLAIELDKRLAAHIHDRFGIEVIQADVLEVELPKFDKVVSNLPYQISSPITLKLLDAEFRKGILMYQKEFAQHLVASPGERAYSRISVMAGYRAECKIIKNVSKGCFHPVPKVDSAIVELVPRRAGFEVLDEDTFKDVVRALFSHKNRKVRNGIMAEHASLGIQKDESKRLAAEVPYSEERPVTLAPEKLAEISNYIYRPSK